MRVGRGQGLGAGAQNQLAHGRVGAVWAQEGTGGKLPTASLHSDFQFSTCEWGGYCSKYL